jgi:hypothetical protein
MVRKHQTTDAQLRNGESRDFGFDADASPRTDAEDESHAETAASTFAIARKSSHDIRLYDGERNR